MTASPKIHFTPNRPCITAEEYIGRSGLVQRAFARLGTDDVQSFAIIGFHKFGKTSFVNYLQQPSVIQQYLGEKGQQYIFLYINLNEKHLNNENEFFVELYQQAESLLGLSDLKGISDLDVITDWLESTNKRLVLILDDFNLIVTNPNYSVLFYERLRSWFSTHKQVGCIVTSPLQLLHLAIPVDLAGSPFFNIFDAYYLEPLTVTEAVTILDSGLPEQMLGQEKEIFEIIKQVGLSPYLIQIAGNIWVSRFEAGKNTELDVLLDLIYQTNLAYYEKIYASLTANQRENIKSLINPLYKTDVVRMDNKLIQSGWVNKDAKKITALQMEKFFQEKFFPKKVDSLSTWMAKIKNFLVRQ
jgi:hypothetical protein